MSTIRILPAATCMAFFGASLLPSARGETPPPSPLAHFTFNGHVRNEAPGAAHWDLRSTEFKDDALHLNGIYEFGPNAGGYHAVCKTPALEFTTFTVTLRYKAESFSDDPARRNLLVGGTAYRWFTVERSQAGNLQITFNGRKFARELDKTPLEVGKWTVVSCGVDLAAKRVTAYLDGKPAGDFSLPDDFRLEIVGSKQEAADKVWSFVNYSNTNLFHGLVDELIIHNRMLSAEEIQDEYQRIPRKRSAVDEPVQGGDPGNEFLTAVERELLGLTNRERFKFGRPPLTASRQLTEAARGHAANMARQQILNHTLDGKTFDQRIDATGYRSSAAGENIWSAATAAGAIEGWMGSPGHQRNMLSADFQEIGVGVGISQSQQKYWTQVFGKPDRPNAAPRAVDRPRDK
ncbi:MAG TPA: CAP domain-containing protein [Planctomycetaceae bacterium]|nr:CAP domain-containing protein [Planctomycetaceae bacterium]